MTLNLCPQSKRYLPKGKRYLPQSKREVLLGILEEFKAFEIFCWGVTVTGVSKISNVRSKCSRNPCGTMTIWAQVSTALIS